MAIFLKYGALEGEATPKGYEKWIEIHSYSWSVGRGISVGIGGQSKREATAPSVSEISVTKSMDVASPLLLKEAVGGKAVDVKIEVTQTDNTGKHIAFQKYILSNTLISGYSVSGAGERPSESFSLSFTKFDSEYLNIDDKFNSKTTGHVIYDLTKASPS
jgi:type VI secretion system secreted protein Hcp